MLFRSSVAKTIVVPLNLIQSDEKGKYVFVVEKNSKGKIVAVKKAVVIGETYGDKAQINSGLDDRSVLITEGYQSLYDQQEIKTQ